MIAKLTGRIDSVLADGAIVDVGGVGYLVFTSRRTLGLLPAAGGPASFFVETHVREDHIHLFGFLDPAERDWFRLLITVQGVGTRVALAILGVVSVEQLAVAVAARDKALLVRADGVGPKLAGRIVAELADKVDAIALRPRSAAGASAPGAETAVAGSSADGVNQDAVSALVNLGYGRAEAFTAVAVAGRALGDDSDVERLIPAALKELAR